MKKEAMAVVLWLVLGALLIFIFYEASPMFAPEVCGNGVDETGEGKIDEGCAKDPAGVIPKPQQINWISDQPVFIDSSWVIAADIDSQYDNFTAHYVRNKFNSTSRLLLQVVNLTETLPAKAIVIGDPTKNAALATELGRHDINVTRDITKGYDQGYALAINGSRVLIGANSSAGRFYGGVTLYWLIANSSTHTYLPNVKILDWPDLDVRGYYGSVEGGDETKFLEKLADWKMNVYTSSMYPFSSPPSSGSINVAKQREKFLRERHFYTIMTINPTYIVNRDPELYEGIFMQNISVTFGTDEIGRANGGGFVPVNNPGFEIDLDVNGIPDNWTMESNANSSWSWDCTQSHSGSCSAKLTVNRQLAEADSSAFTRTGYHPIRKNSMYQLTVWARKSNFASTGQFTMVLFPATGSNYLSIANVDLRHVGTSWTKVSILFPSGEAERFSLYSRASGSPVMQMWIDDIELKDIGSSFVNVLNASNTEPRVWSTDKTIRYTKGVDYSVSYIGRIDAQNPLAGRNATISRIPGGNIPSQATVLVDYNFVPRMQQDRNETNTFADPLAYEVYNRTLAATFPVWIPDIVFIAHPSETRGFNRDSRSQELGLENYQLMSQFINNLTSMIKSYNESMRIWLWDDMVSPHHNGGIDYQVQYGGPKGKTWYSLDTMSRDVELVNWWYGEDWAYKLSNSHNIYNQYGYTWFGGPWFHEYNIKWWSTLAYYNNGSGLIDHYFGGSFIGIPLTANYSWNAVKITGESCSTDYLEICDGRDNDCDSEYWINSWSTAQWPSPVDEGFNLTSDLFNCGACGNFCYYQHGFSSCVAGGCQFDGCFEGYEDANGNLADGCERPMGASAGFCGDGICEGSLGEDQISCSLDCGSPCTDNDLDGYNATSGGVCGTVADCNDGHAGSYPGATEICDGLDNNCVAGSDEGGVCGTVSYYCDADADGYRSLAVSGSCSSFNCVPAGCSTTVGNDCNDASGGINPGATDASCNAVDEDCSGVADDDYVPTATTCGVGACAGGTGQNVCSNGAIVNTCDPFWNSTAESCSDNTGYDGIDQSCDGSPDMDCSAYCDMDGDDYSPHFICVFAGYSTGDCNDLSAAIHPGAVELCDAIDNDCSENNDGVGEAWYGQVTSCGVGQCGATGQLLCVGGAPSNSCVAGSPGTEICDGLDNDCDSSTDEGGDSLCTQYSASCVTNVCNGVAGCSYTPSDAACSDGSFCSGTETCDLAFGCQPGTPLCSENEFCEESIPSCEPITCNLNGIADGTELCDGADLRGKNCIDLGYPAGGTLSCGLDCTYITDTCSRLPAYNNFNGNTTNFAQEIEITGVIDPVLEIVPYGMINFSGHTLSFERIDLDAHVIIEDKRIGINSVAVPSLNVSATLKFYNVSSPNPQVYRDGTACTSCTAESHVGSVLTVRVPSFSVYTVVDGPYCGDLSCNAGETCSTCPGDCGQCNSDSGGGSSGGGGGTPNRPVNPIASCTEMWQCGSWSECSDGVKTRHCYDVRACGTTNFRPSLNEECAEEFVPPTLPRFYGDVRWDVVIAIVVSILSLVGLVVSVVSYYVRKKRLIHSREMLLRSASGFNQF